MVFNLTDEACYLIDRGLYEQKMAFENMIFMLTKHAEDENADYLESEAFQKLHDKTIAKTATRWFRETEVIGQYTNEPVKFYNFDLTSGILTVETK